jgi:hypothetical protein
MDSTYEMVKELIDFNSEGVDTYNHNGSTWLIFTDQKKWVIELTKEKTLWYNYYFFTGVFKYLSLDVVENQHYITKWVEDTVINGVKSTKGEYYKEIQKVEYTIQNGVKRTIADDIRRGWPIIEDTIQNGVKKTKRSYEGSRKQRTKDTIQNGVKHTSNRRLVVSKDIEDTIENGVKKTVPIGIDKDSIVSNDFGMNEAIQNGVKVTYSDKIPHEYDWTDQFDVKEVIETGVKHTEKSLQIDGSCVIEDVIKEGVKHTEYGDWLDGDERLDDIIDNGIKETHDDAYHHTGRVDGVIKNGVKQCIPSHTPLYNPMDFSVQYRENHRLDDVASVLEKGIKKTKVMDEWVNTDRIVDGVISGGAKKSPI